MAGTLSAPGCLDGGEAAGVASVDEALNLHLSDGRIVRLAGIHAEAADRLGPADRPRATLTSWLEHADVRVLPLRREADRWGRTVALVFAPTHAGAAQFVSVTEAMLDAGLAEAEPDSEVEACWATYLHLEDGARRERSGLWQNPDAVLAPDDRQALARRLGLWTLVEGRISAVRVGQARTYLRFSDDGGSGLAIAVDRATMRRLVQASGGQDGWVGRRVLARGLLDDRWGLQIDVSTPAQIRLSQP